MGGSELQGARRAALWLHDLPAEVGREVLKRLRENERSQLEPLLRELKEMGIVPQREREFDRSTVRQLMRDATETLQPSARELAARLDGRVVARCLESCADGLLTRWLQSAAWVWKETVLEQLEKNRRDSILEGLQAPNVPLAPAVLEVLCSQLCDCAERLSLDDDAVQCLRNRREARWLDGFLAWLKRCVLWTR
jgi:hypothetical protein